MQHLFNSTKKSAKKPKEDTVVEEEEDEDVIQVHTIKPTSLMKLLFSEQPATTSSSSQKQDDCIGHFEQLGDDTILEEPVVVSQAQENKPPQVTETVNTLSVEIVEHCVTKQVEGQTNQTDDMKIEIVFGQKEENLHHDGVVAAVAEPASTETEMVTEIVEIREVMDVHVVTEQPQAVVEGTPVTDQIEEQYTTDENFTDELQHVVIDMPGVQTATAEIERETEPLVSCDELVEHVLDTLVHSVTEQLVEEVEKEENNASKENVAAVQVVEEDVAAVQVVDEEVTAVKVVVEEEADVDVVEEEVTAVKVVVEEKADVDVVEEEVAVVQVFVEEVADELIVEEDKEKILVESTTEDKQISEPVDEVDIKETVSDEIVTVAPAEMSTFF
jgi:hypothetical protein